MSRYEDMDAAELRAERDHWRDQVCIYAREYLAARQSGDFAWEVGIRAALEQALGQVKRLDALLKLGVAA